MKRENLESAKHKLVPAKKPDNAVKATKNQTFLDGVKVFVNDKTDQPVEFLYDRNAQLVDKEREAFAKKVQHASGRKEFFGKIATTGPAVGHFLNPWGSTYNEGDENRYEKEMGRYRYELQKVSEGIFNSYLRFLETKSERYIIYAERELLNDRT